MGTGSGQRAGLSGVVVSPGGYSEGKGGADGEGVGEELVLSIEL